MGHNRESPQASLEESSKGTGSNEAGPTASSPGVECTVSRASSEEKGPGAWGTLALLIDSKARAGCWRYCRK